MSEQNSENEPSGLFGMVNDLKKLLGIRDTHIREGNMAGLLSTDAKIMRLDEEILTTSFIDVTAVGRALGEVRCDSRDHLKRNQKRVDGQSDVYSDPIEEKKRLIQREFDRRPGHIFTHPNPNPNPDRGLLR